jgi:formylmethanofuran dehydrogenase subunit E
LKIFRDNKLGRSLALEGFDILLEGSATSHGHLCPGQVVGVRMAMLGCRLIGLDDPQRLDQLKKLIVYVELDRCTADAVAYVTGVKLGRRSLKFVDYGIMAATFLNLETNAAFRIISKEESRALVSQYAPEIENETEQKIIAYRRMPIGVLFKIQKVSIPYTECDLPGHTRKKVVCIQCGQTVRDNKEVIVNDQPLCRPCANGAYFENPVEINPDKLPFDDDQP